MTVSERRSAVRAAGLAGRRAVTGPDREQAEASLVDHLMSMQVLANSFGRSATSVGVFLANDGEPDLAHVFDALRAAGHRLALPVLSDDADDYTMHFYLWNEGDELVPGRYGISVPRRPRMIAPKVLLVPLVAFDSELGRMGRGKGYYDRYLASCSAYRIGVGLEAQRVPDVEAQSHDVCLHAVVTNLGVRFAPTHRVHD